MVKEFHRAGIEVILDVVYNHTCEGNEHGSTLSFRGLANSIYYILDREGRYHNYSGCGNTVNCNHPVVRDLIISSLVYLATELHVDGFRFDLASILGRGEDGRVLEDPPLIRHIAEHPLLAGAKLLAEAWDAAGLHQLGKFPAWGRWAEFNGHFRDDVRHWVRSDPARPPPWPSGFAAASTSTATPRGTPTTRSISSPATMASPSTTSSATTASTTGPTARTNATAASTTSATTATTRGRPTTPASTPSASVR